MTKYIILITISSLLFFASCGKKSEQIKKEKEMNAQIMEIHHKQMDVYYKVDSLVKQLELKAVDTSFALQIEAAKDLLSNFKLMMDTWMENYEAYNPKMEHIKAIEKLEKDKYDLEKMNFEMENALKETNAILK